jgi:hypothetical protein
MKTKNDLKTGILIGIGMIVIPLILMGTTNYTTEKKNKFELHNSLDYSGNLLLNTENGDLWRVTSTKKQKVIEEIKK